ncbi:uncharacterized protein BO97DRAFT_6145 [Aspergillus homomorphus CBS 101889]|uniref:Uncharacterized protein n=1 Tax=Aspergillus homomorphus (strain CBS 101889) TaxID=1450537 RepID=A0A395IE29_ASPHC|nr:hypothetical protein BO97DRAFT_6145 [Aspergillus homomorphus CBS 101889]RAL17408.1 hypothetical protein BO97DRAFT_6145 [Aspergillus homomorphus CBS 101889]
MRGICFASFPTFLIQISSEHHGSDGINCKECHERCQHPVMGIPLIHTSKTQANRQQYRRAFLKITLIVHRPSVKAAPAPLKMRQLLMLCRFTHAHYDHHGKADQYRAKTDRNDYGVGIPGNICPNMPQPGNGATRRSQSRSRSRSLATIALLFDLRIHCR